MIGCDLAAIERGEDRKLFNEAMAEIGLEVARSGYAYSVADAEAIAERVGYPCVLRPAFHPRRRRRRHRSHPRGARPIVSQGLSSRRPRGAGRGVHRGLERVRDGGHA